jgi:uncharacterized protein involved in exopolysaccharide biosynthesis
MVEQGPHFAAEQAAPAEAESEGFDLEQARELGGFIVRAARRRPRLTVFTFVSVAVVGLTAAATMPRVYSSEVKLLAQRSSAIRAISGNANNDPDANPTQNVAAMIMRRDNLIALANDAHLVERFAATRPAALRFKDRVLQSIFGAPSEEDKLLGMVFTLERQLVVSTNVDEAKEANLTISVEWSNPRIAFDLVTLVQKNFLEARYDSEVAVINDGLSVLEDHAKTELDKVDAELAVYQKMVAERSTAMSAAQSAAKATSRPQAPMVLGPRTSASGAAAPVFIPDPEVTKALEEKRMQIRALEDARQHTIASLRQQLVQAQLTLTPLHPSVIALQQQLDAVSQTPPELAQLRSEERSLMTQLVPPRLAPTASSTPALQGFGPRPFASLTAPAADAGAAAEPDSLFFGMDRDGPLRLEESKLASAIREYEDAMGRIDSARVELEITRAAYKYKYTVVTPAELPKTPMKATARTVAMGSVLGGLLLALLLAAGIDLARGSILESWQVRRRLKLQVLGELDRPA